MAIATYSSALNDRALCTSIALTMVRRAYVQALSQVTGKPAVTVVHRSRLAHYFVMLSGFKTRPSAAARRISASCCAHACSRPAYPPRPGAFVEHVPMVDQPTEASCATGGSGRSRDSSAPRARPPHQAALAPRAPAGSAVRDSAAPTPADEARPRATPRVGRSRTNGLPSPTKCLHSAEAAVRPPTRKSGFDLTRTLAANFDNATPFNHVLGCPAEDQPQRLR
jgi:hypothetical protein